MGPPNAVGMKGPLDVVVVYAFDCTTTTPDWNRVNEVYWMVQSKLAQFPGSCLSYLYAWLASNRYTTEKRMVGVKNILPESTTGCTKNMASGLPEAHRLIGLSSVNPNGIILLFSDGSSNNKKCDFFDQAEDYISTVPVHTFTLGSDAYNQGLRNIAANSPGGTFNSIPIPDKPDDSSPLSLVLDAILSGKMIDDEKPPTSNTGSTKGLVSINQVKYFKDDAALTADTVTAEVEIRATSSTAVREGLDLVAVLDVSCRVATKAKIESLKNAMKFVVMKLTPVDRLSIVTFTDGAARLNPLRSVTPAAQKDLIAIVDGLSARGGTNIKAGLDTGLAVIAGRANTKARTANIFLMSDGKQTVGDARAVDPGQVAIYTFGFGDDSDHQLLSDLAARSPGGMFSSVPDGADLSVPFSQLLGGLLTVVAQNVQLNLTPKTAEGDVDTVVVARGTDYTQSVDDGSGVITIKFGTLFAGEGRKVVVTLGLKDSTATQEYDASLAEAQHVFTAQGKVQAQTPQDIQILRTRNPSQAPGDSAKARQLQAELARRAQAEAIRQARILADAGDLDEARYKLVDAQNALEDIALDRLDEGEKLVSSLRAELVQLIRLMDSKDIYKAKGHAYALASEASHGRQRYCARGGDDADDVRLFATPRMDAYREQAKNFEKDTTAPVPTADEDVKKEIAANPLVAISGDLAYYLRNAIEALQAIQKIIAPTA